MPLLDVENLRVSFPSRFGAIRAVDGVTFRVAEGETLGVVGESGSGKSVTALAVMGLLPESARIMGGSIALNGRELLELDEQHMAEVRGRDVAMVFQDPMTSLNPVLTIGRQIAESIEAHASINHREALRQSAALLGLVGIPDATQRLGAYPHEFSGGMRQRVMLAMALACRPTLLIADEITTALDVTTQAQVLDLVAQTATGLAKGLLLITHDLAIVAGMADRVMVMYAGTVVEIGPAEELFAHPGMPYTWGLMQSVPRLDLPRVDELVAIEGTPPDSAHPPSGCRFAPRCPYRRAICEEKVPELLQVPGSSVDHAARCWGTQPIDGGGWLIESHLPNPSGGFELRIHGASE